MKKMFGNIFFALFILLCSVGIADSSAFACEAMGNVVYSVSESEELRSVEIPRLSAGYISEGISLPVQSLVRSNSSNGNMTRLANVLGSVIYKEGKPFVCRSVYKQYELSSPFYCTPPCKYYVFALRHLII
jgi:hypothetical protein